MSNTDLSLFEGPTDGVPAHLRKQMEERGVRSFNTGGIGSYIKANNAGLITVVKEGAVVKEIEDDGYIDVVVIDLQANIGRMYYEDAYSDEADAKPPTCWSDDGREAHADADSPSKTGLCDKCPKNEKGSSDDGEGKACSFSRVLACIIPGMGSTIFTLRAKGQSIFAPDQPERRRFNLKNYTKLLAAQKLDPAAVKTRIFVNRKSATVQLFFGPPDASDPQAFFLTAKQYAQINKIVDASEEERTSLLVTNPMGRSSETGTKEKVVGRKAKAEAAEEKPAPKKAAAKKAPAKKAAPKKAAAEKPADEEVEVIPPKKKPAAKKKAAAKEPEADPFDDLGGEVEDAEVEEEIEVDEETLELDADDLGLDAEDLDGLGEEEREEEVEEAAEEEAVELDSVDDLDDFIDGI